MSDLRRRILYDHDGDALTSHVRQDVEPYLENNARLREQEQKTDGLKHVASIPLVVIEQWLNEEVARGATHLTLASKEMDQIIRRKLRDPAWKYLLVAEPLVPWRR